MTNKRPRDRWKLECVDKMFLETCIHELTTNDREGSGLKGSSLNVLMEKLKNLQTFIVDKKNIRKIDMTT